MDIRTLKTFVAVAQLKGFSAAARFLNTVQPAVSRQISDLEAELGTALFRRSTREVRITAAGEVLLREAEEILAHVDHARHLVQRAGKGEVGRLRIGFISSAAQSFLPGLIRNFTAAYPDVLVSLSEETASEQYDALLAGQLDVALSRPLPSAAPKYLESLEIYSDRLLAYLPLGHPLAKKPVLSLTDFAGSQMVLFKRSGAPDLYDQIIHACQEAGVSPRIASQPNNMQAVLTEVAAGLGASIAPGCIRQIAMTGYLWRPLLEDCGGIPFQLHYRTDEPEPATTAFVKMVQDQRPEIRKSIALPAQQVLSD